MSELFIFAGLSRRQRVGWRRLLLPGFLFLTLGPARGQEAYRASLAGEAAAEARKQQLDNDTSYNLKAGPMKLRLSAETEVDATDNVNLTGSNPQGDVTVSPSLHVLATWRVSEQNALTFATGIGYAKYLSHSELDHIFITPDSDLGFHFTVGDFVVNLHNSFSISQEAYNQPALSSTANYNTFSDTAGVNVDWDLSESMILTFGYNHEMATYSPALFSYQDHNSELFSLRAAFVFNPQTQAGLELGAGLVNYDHHDNGTTPTTPPTPPSGPPSTPTTTTPAQAFSATNSLFLSDLVSYNFGPFLKSQLTEYIGVTLAGGYTVYAMAQTNSFQQTLGFSAFYADLTLDHRVNEKLQYSFSVGRQIQLGVYSATLDLYYARLEPTWLLFEKMTLRTPIFYEYATQDGVLAEKIGRFGAGIEVSYQLTQKLQTRASYNYLSRSSNLPESSYIQNRLVLDLQYSF